MSNCYNGSEPKPGAPTSGWVRGFDAVDNYAVSMLLRANPYMYEKIEDVGSFCRSPRPEPAEGGSLISFNPLSIPGRERLMQNARVLRWDEWCRCKPDTTCAVYDTYPNKLGVGRYFFTYVTETGEAGTNEADIRCGGWFTYSMGGDLLVDYSMRGCGGSGEIDALGIPSWKRIKYEGWSVTRVGDACGVVSAPPVDPFRDLEIPDYPPPEAAPPPPPGCACSAEIALATATILSGAGINTTVDGVRHATVLAAILAALGAQTSTILTGTAAEIANIIAAIEEAEFQTKLRIDAAKEEILDKIGSPYKVTGVRFVDLVHPDNLSEFPSSHGQSNRRLGWFAWKVGDYTLPKQELNYVKSCFISPHPDIIDFEYNLHPGVWATPEIFTVGN